VNELVDVLLLVVFVYVAVYNLATLTLLTLSLSETSAVARARRARVAKGPRTPQPLQPSITVVVPAYNEEPVIVASVGSILAGTYEPLRVVVVDDGSTDGTSAALGAAYDLVELPVGGGFGLETEPIERVPISRSDPRLRVVRKVNGGRSDAVNAGIAVARHDLVAVTDADGVLEPDAIALAVAAFTADPSRVVACGGIVRIANGGRFLDNRLVEPRVRVRGIEATQTVEYLRSFLGSRIAWARLNALLIVSGAFGVFRRDVLLETGGFSRQTLGEDMELTMRLYHRLRPSHPEMRIAFVPDAVCWTEAPSKLGGLRSQRMRWHVGLIDNLRLHRAMFGRRFGLVGRVALPYAILFEAIAPLVELLGFALVVGLFLANGTTGWSVVAFVVVAILLGQIQTAGAILVEEVGFRRYRSRDLLLLGLWSLLELFWYRPLTLLWRVWATGLLLVGRRPGWGTIPRGEVLGVDHDDALVPQTLPLPR
jgi:cellulose synthase/poly-beta-1,6-N-acetylglucosamine synthase-like glycosyltransferase